MQRNGAARSFSAFSPTTLCSAALLHRESAEKKVKLETTWHESLKDSHCEEGGLRADVKLQAFDGATNVWYVW